VKFKNHYFIISLILLIITLLTSIFIFNPWDPATALLIGILSILIPGILCLGWYFYWQVVSDPIKFLARWNAATQALFMVLLLIQVEWEHWGLLGGMYIILTIAVISISNLESFKHPIIFTLGEFLALMNVLVPIAFLLIVYDFTLLTGISELGVTGAVRLFGLQAGSAGVLFTAASQMYWYEAEKRRRDEEILEDIVSRI
jgi:hypothetical protein